MRNFYTVILRPPDDIVDDYSAPTMLRSLEAESADEAVGAAMRLCSGQYEVEDPNDFALLHCFLGIPAEVDHSPWVKPHPMALHPDKAPRKNEYSHLLQGNDHNIEPTEPINSINDAQEKT